MADDPQHKTTDPKARVRAALMAAGALRPVEVSRDDLAEVLRELGDLRQIVQQQAKGLRDAGNKALAENRSMGRVFANAGYATVLRENGRLRAALDGMMQAHRTGRYEPAVAAYEAARCTMEDLDGRDAA